MRVAYILNCFPNISNTFIINEIVAMQDRGIDIKVFAFSRPQEKKTHAKAELIKNVFYFPRKQWLRKIFFHFYWLISKPHRYILTAFIALYPGSGIFRLFVSALPHVYSVYLFKPSLIHAHFGCLPADFSMLARLITGIPFTFTTHGYDIHRHPPKNYPLKTLLAHKHITISNFNKKILTRKFGVNEEKIAVIRCGIDFDNFAAKESVSGDISQNTIISVARLEYIKGIDVLIRACKILSDKNFNFECKIAGEGPQRPFLENLISELGLNQKVTLLGSRTQEEVFSLMKCARLMVLPSRSESLSVALMEAMACRVPAIGPNMMGNPELIKDGINGFLVEPDDASGLAQRMQTVLSNDSLSKRFSRKAYQEVLGNFNLKNETEKLFEVWLSKTG